jgi:hypothetical protein
LLFTRSGNLQPQTGRLSDRENAASMNELLVVFCWPEDPC